MTKRRFFIGLAIIILAALGGGAFAYVKEKSAQQPAQQTPSTPVVAQKDPLTCTEDLPLDTQIGQKLMFAGYSDLLASEKASFQQANLGGVIIMDETPGASIADFTNGFAISPLVGVDQEGGTVQRYKSEGLLAGASQMTANSTQAAYQAYLKDDKYLASLGITTNFAPVVDVLSANPSPLPGRMYSSDPTVVTDYATQAIKASQDSSITPVIKHFPGLGSATGNTDDESATTDPIDTLKTRDLIPYQKLASFKADVMVSNAIVPGLTDGQPASLSSGAVSLLRTMYPSAVVYSDSLTAKAIPGSLSDATIAAWKAGIDVALIAQKHDESSQISADVAAINTAAESALQSGALSKKDFADSVLRILQRKHVDPCAIKN
jgi:beta-N-acetylhexosaminidase